ncbi:hypothetical protein DM02DRAFT_628556 [Periconia macrospinosa]|uniref:Uncharacterized protein n=1 Tax=Periconia macrospinosa TaxID=97972 RepID=A0A2V1DSS2_9PLEO|nr:hypothetical protein DM02DRAFT_628556 [Periconia macrospinosa]
METTYPNLTPFTNVTLSSVKPQFIDTFSCLSRGLVRNDEQENDGDQSRKPEAQRRHLDILFRILKCIPAYTDYIHYVLLDNQSSRHCICTEACNSDDNVTVQLQTKSTSCIAPSSKYTGDLGHFLEDIGSLPLVDSPPRARTLRFTLSRDILREAAIVPHPDEGTIPATKFVYHQDIHPPHGTINATASEFQELFQHYGSADAIPVPHIVRLNLSLLSISFSVEMSLNVVKPPVVGISRSEDESKMLLDSGGGRARTAEDAAGGEGGEGGEVV